MKIVNVCPTEGDKVIADTGILAPWGVEVDVDADLAGKPPKGDPGDDKFDPGSGLLAQRDVWALPTTNLAKDAMKTAARRPKTDPSDTPEEQA